MSLEKKAMTEKMINCICAVKSNFYVKSYFSSYYTYIIYSHKLWKLHRNRRSSSLNILIVKCILTSKEMS